MPPPPITTNFSRLKITTASIVTPTGKGEGGAPWTVRTTGNSVGVAISQPRVEGRSTSTLGNNPLNCSNSVGVAISRRRYHSRKISRPMANATSPNIK